MHCTDGQYTNAIYGRTTRAEQDQHNIGCQQLITLTPTKDTRDTIADFFLSHQLPAPIRSKR